MTLAFVIDIGDGIARLRIGTFASEGPPDYPLFKLAENSSEWIQIQKTLETARSRLNGYFESMKSIDRMTQVPLI